MKKRILTRLVLQAAIVKAKSILNFAEPMLVTVLAPLIEAAEMVHRGATTIESDSLEKPAFGLWVPYGMVVQRLKSERTPIEFRIESPTASACADAVLKDTASSLRTLADMMDRHADEIAAARPAFSGYPDAN